MKKYVLHPSENGHVALLTPPVTLWASENKYDFGRSSTGKLEQKKEQPRLCLITYLIFSEKNTVFSKVQCPYLAYFVEPKWNERKVVSS